MPAISTVRAPATRDSRPGAVARGARAGLERPVPVDAHVSQPAAEFRVAPAGAVLDGKNAVVGVAELVVFDSHVVNPLAFQERPNADGEEDVLEEAVRDADALSPNPRPARNPDAARGARPRVWC